MRVVSCALRPSQRVRLRAVNDRINSLIVEVNQELGVIRVQRQLLLERVMVRLRHDPVLSEAGHRSESARGRPRVDSPESEREPGEKARAGVATDLELA